MNLKDLISFLNILNVNLNYLLDNEYEKYKVRQQLSLEKSEAFRRKEMQEIRGIIYSSNEEQKSHIPLPVPLVLIEPIEKDYYNYDEVTYNELFDTLNDMYVTIISVNLPVDFESRHNITNYISRIYKIVCKRTNNWQLYNKNIINYEDKFNPSKILLHIGKSAFDETFIKIIQLIKLSINLNDNNDEYINDVIDTMIENKISFLLYIYNILINVM